MTIRYSLIVFTQCYTDKDENKNPNCPVCQDYLNQLADSLPYAHCSQSRLYCHISGLPLNENNQPMMLPNGYVYGEQVISFLLSKKLICLNDLYFVVGVRTNG